MRPVTVLSPAVTGASVRLVDDEQVAVKAQDAEHGGFRAALRVLRPVVGDRAISAAGAATALERLVMRSDPPSVARCVMLETASARAVAVDSSPGVSAFLDGVQRSRVVAFVDGAPIVFATVAAVIRERHDRRLSTWRAPSVRHMVLAARESVGESAWTALADADILAVDVAEDGAVPVHPLSVRAMALDRVAEERETLERRLAAEWCQRESRWLWIDGGISGNLAVSAESTAFGVVKSHTTLYGNDESIRASLALAEGERGPLFLVQHRGRRGVASWYLRMHAGHGDPLHGLVRIEIAPPAGLMNVGAAGSSAEAEEWTANAVPDLAALGKLPVLAMLRQRADEVSAWILAERAPLALPDPRWDTLCYGVYACEQFLKALVGS